MYADTKMACNRLGPCLLYSAKSGRYAPLWFVVLPAVNPLKLMESVLSSNTLKNDGRLPLQAPT